MEINFDFFYGSVKEEIFALHIQFMFSKLCTLKLSNILNQTNFLECNIVRARDFIYMYIYILYLIFIYYQRYCIYHIIDQFICLIDFLQFECMEKSLIIVWNLYRGVPITTRLCFETTNVINKSTAPCQVNKTNTKWP